MLHSLERARQPDERRRVLRSNVDRVGQPPQFVPHLRSDTLPPGRPQPVPQQFRINAARDGHQPLPAGHTPIGKKTSCINPVVQRRREGDGECRAGFEVLNRRLNRQRFDVHSKIAEGPGILTCGCGVVEFSLNGRRPLHAELLQPVAPCCNSRSMSRLSRC
jgi:hypothetical protein